MKSRSQPRYRVPEGRKSKPTRQALDLKPQSALKGWVRMVARFLIVSTAIPYLVFRVWLLAVNPYRVYFEARPAAVKLDGQAIPLDSANGFGLSRFALGDHLLRYTDAGGATKTIRIHPRLADEDGTLSIDAGRLSGTPKAEFVQAP